MQPKEILSFVFIHCKCIVCSKLQSKLLWSLPLIFSFQHYNLQLKIVNQCVLQFQVTPFSLFDELGTNCEHIYIDITDAGDHKFAHLCKACKRETAKDGVLLAKSPGSVSDKVKNKLFARQKTLASGWWKTYVVCLLVYMWKFDWWAATISLFAWS